MFSGKRILAVVPARGGSKGIKLKNLRKINGVSLIELVGRVVAKLPYLDRAVVSTDHDMIIQAAVESGLEAPFRRPAELSRDLIGDVEVLTHALLATEEEDGRHYDVILMLQPTSPLRTPDQVTATLEKLLEGGFDSVFTVSQTDAKAHPFKQFVVDGDIIDFYDPRGKNIVARQQLSTLYHKNGVAYAMTRECLLVHKTVMGPNASAYIIDAPMVNIDTEVDLLYAEFLMGLNSENDG